jgi:hypothetical protein
MDRITHQSPRQRGYGSTSSPMNDSLKHTWKHKKGRKESNQEAKHTGSGRPSGQKGRTVRTGLTDRPACCRGPSAPTPRTVRPYAADRRIKHTEPLEANPENGPSAGCTRTDRQAPADRPPSAADHSKPLQPKLKTKTDQKRSQARTRRTLFTRTVRQTLADRPPGTVRTENSPTPKVNSPKSSSDFPNGRSYTDKGLGT